MGAGGASRDDDLSRRAARYSRPMDSGHPTLASPAPREPASRRATDSASSAARARAGRAVGLQQALPPVPRNDAESEGPLRRGAVEGSAGGGARTAAVLRQARRRDRDAARTRVQCRRVVVAVLAAGQVPVHQPAARPSAARVRGDVLQLGVLPHPASQLLQQRVPVRAPDDLDGAPRFGPARLSRLLPRQRRHARLVPRGVRRLRPCAALRRPRPRPQARSGRSADALRAAVRTPDEPPDPVPLVALLPQQGGLRDRPHFQRACGRAVRDPDPARRERQARRRHGPVRHGRPARPVQFLARVLHGRHRGARSLRDLPARNAADAAEVRALQHGRAAEARQGASSIAISCITSPTRPTTS